jgi:hypothetical protein
MQIYKFILKKMEAAVKMDNLSNGRRINKIDAAEQLGTGNIVLIIIL